MVRLAALAMVFSVACAATQEGPLIPDAPVLQNPLADAALADAMEGLEPGPDAPVQVPGIDAPLPPPPPDAPIVSMPDAPVVTVPDAAVVPVPDGCAPVIEQCNGRDDNCNGLVDEGFPLGTPCFVGVGECRQQGIMLCNAEGTGVTCSAEPLEPAPIDLCKNGLDDDCDGQVDEDFPQWGTICYRGEGECERAGLMVCNEEQDGLECNAIPGPPEAELCGTRHDENCDGLVDEGFADIGKPCSDGEGECKVEGEIICDPQDLTKTKCSAIKRQPQQETCNGKDDDCDGVIDNGNPGGNTIACNSGQQGECGPGKLQCVSGGLVCVSSMPMGGTEVCDYKDNDCDGIVDNGFHVGEPCNSTDPIDWCFDGTIDCDGPFTTKCVGDAPSPEVCNNADDNCNGQVDEIWNFFDDPDNCGGCSKMCTNAHGTRTCTSGVCNPTCDLGWQSCDNNLNNGCEKLRNDDANLVCPGDADYLFKASGDKPRAAFTTSHYGEKRFRVRVEENDDGADSLHVQFRLDNPDGVMMQLCVTCLTCGGANTVCATQAGTQRIWASADETPWPLPGWRDDFDAIVEIRYISSERTACGNWTLTIFSESDPPAGALDLDCD